MSLAGVVARTDEWKGTRWELDNERSQLVTGSRGTQRDPKGPGTAWVGWQGVTQVTPVVLSAVCPVRSRFGAPRSVLCCRKHLNAKELNPVWAGAGAVPAWTSCPPPRECPGLCPRCPGSGS